MQRIPLKHQEYVRASDWDGSMRRMEEEGITDGGCVVAGGFGWHLDGGYEIFANFGEIICYALQDHISSQLDTYEVQAQLDPSEEQRQARLLVAEPALDELLGKFLANGYEKGMKEQLQKIVNAAQSAFEIDSLWVLPEDLESLLEDAQPFSDYKTHVRPYDDHIAHAGEPEIDEDEQAAMASKLVFNWQDPEHRIALVERIELLNC